MPHSRCACRAVRSYDPRQKPNQPAPERSSAGVTMALTAIDDSKSETCTTATETTPSRDVTRAF